MNVQAVGRRKLLRGRADDGLMNHKRLVTDGDLRCNEIGLIERALIYSDLAPVATSPGYRPQLECKQCDRLGRQTSGGRPDGCLGAQASQRSMAPRR